jgi:hypothetical protein
VAERKREVLEAKTPEGERGMEQKDLQQPPKYEPSVLGSNRTRNNGDLSGLGFWRSMAGYLARKVNEVC